jgi:hypothetical protein
VKDSEEADPGAHALGICRNGQQSFRRCLEQHVVNKLRILKRERSELAWKSDNYMAVGDGQQLLRCFRQPPVSRAGLAAGATPIAAGIELHSPFIAVITLFEPCTAGIGTACADVPECFALLVRKRFTPARKELLFVLTKDIGDFKSPGGHF